MKYPFTLFKPPWWYAEPKQGLPRWVYDTELDKQLDMSWAEICETLTAGHKTVEVKYESDMFSLCKWVDPNWKENEDGKYIYTRSGNLKKVAKNVESFPVLVLDYDSGMWIDDFIAKYRHLTHVGYTSHSHTDSFHKFRVAIPLTKPIPASLLIKPKNGESILPALFEVFGGLDLSSFDRARSFFMPSAPSATIDQAMSWSVSGEPFDWTALKLSPPIAVFKNVISDDVEPTDIVQLFKDNGLYLGHSGGAKHDVICPWAKQHTNGDTTGTAIWDRQGFSCFHGGCKTRTYKELMEFFGLWRSNGGQTSARFGDIDTSRLYKTF